ncbi:type VII secretion integral membrane protein EccD [Leucobacter albus]|uniref:Type VII secretion integral membrane protein EccD n=1 Tax=Leucobacter albus TaxID=272210 RepID=A0ABW3TSQ8_9MICO
MTAQAPAELDAIVRVSVVHAERRVDLVLPGRLPLVEVLPGIARGLGVLDPTVLHGGYRLTRADGSALDPRRGALAQGIDQGEILTLGLGGLIAAPKQYDDLVEAVIDATSSHHAAWQPADAARTATAVSLTLVALSAILLALQPHTSFAPAAMAAAGTVVLLAMAATLSRLRQHESGIAFGIAAAGFGALSGYLFTPAELDLWGYPLAAAGAGAIVAGGVAMLTVQRPVEMLALPIAFGAIVALPASVVGVTGIAPAGPYAIMVAIAATVAGALPWLTLSSTRVRVVSPTSDTEMFAPPPPIDGDRVKARINAGHRLLVAVRVAFALAVLVATPVVAAGNWMGTVLTVIAGATLMFQSRQSARRASVLVLLIGGTAIMAVSGLVSILTHPDEAPLLLIVLLSATGLITGLTLLSDRVRMRLTRLGDGIEVILLVLLLPLAVIAAGIA